MPSGQATVRDERRGRVLIVGIEREAKRNAIDHATADGIDEAVERVTASDDMREGIAAFFEKRPPRRTGR